MKLRIAVIEDEISLRLSLEVGFVDLGYDVKTAANLQEGIQVLRKYQPDLLFLDIRLPDGNGIEILPELKRSFPNLQIVMMTAYGNTAMIVQAIKNGANNYLNKPFEWEEVELLTKQIIGNLHLQKEVERYKWKEEKSKLEGEEFIGESEEMKALLKKIALVAPTEASILVEGETGTGKERVAQLIHQQSMRNTKPFLALNCGAIPAQLLESELFGYEKGAFTGAANTKMGLLEWVDEGTLFLDEIGEMPLELQIKLLRFLEERAFRRVGGHKDIEINIRIISATNRSLGKMIEEGLFRNDLYYRLNVVPIYVPPLRAREADLIALCHYYFSLFSKQLGKEIPALSESDILAIASYPWPGNVRELKNIIERYVILYESGLQIGSLLNRNESRHSSHSEKIIVKDELSLPPSFSLEKEVEKLEKEYMIHALKKTKWNVTKSAELLGVSRFALQRKIEKYQL